MGTVIMIITILAAILLILIVMVQNPKGGGLDSTFGNVNKLGGVAQSTETIEKATWTLAGAIGVLSLIAVMNFGSAPVSEETNIENTMPSSQMPMNNPVPSAPITPIN